MRIGSEYKIVTGTKKEAKEVTENAIIKVPGLPFVRNRYFRHVGKYTRKWDLFWYD